MRSRYHIKVKGENKDGIDAVLKNLGIVKEFTTYLNNDGVDSYDIIVSLSKYELLYLRLACKTGFILEIDKNQHEIA